MTTVFQEIQRNTALIEAGQDVLISQMSDLLDIQANQLAVQSASLRAQEHLRALASRQLEVGREQLVAALRIAKKLDITNETLGRIETTLGDVSGLLVQQNALLQKSLKKLSAEAQELIERGIEAYNHGWYLDARRDFEAADSKDPYSTVAYYFLARCLRKNGDIEESDRAYEKCLVYSRANAPLFRSLALCDIARQSAESDDPTAARRLLAEAAACPEADLVAVATTALAVDCVAQSIDDGTRRVVESAFAKEHVDPELLISVLRKQVPGQLKGALKDALSKEFESWQRLAQAALHERLLSHFYREVSDFAYLAPRVREGYLHAAEGRFHSLIAPVADLLEWTATTCEHIAINVDVFPKKYPDVLRLYRCLQDWNALLVRMKKLASRLAGQYELTNETFVKKLNLGLVELPHMYEDDQILLEVTTSEGDVLGLSCYYAIFMRNGQEHFAVPLEDIGVLSFETYPHAELHKGVVVRDIRTGQTLLQGTTPGFRYEGDTNATLHFYVDIFVMASRLLGEVHECLHWAAVHEEELFSVCLLLNAIVERQKKLGYSTTGRVSSSRPAKVASAVKADHPDVIEDEPEMVSDEPDVVE